MSTIRSKVIACIIPAILVLAPFLMFVAVLAIAPVAGIPPKNGTTIFPIPCEMSSLLELCLVPVIPSATTAESNDSIAPNIAIVNADGKSMIILFRCKFKKVISGNPEGMLPTVGIPVKNKLVMIPAASANGAAGNFLINFCHMK